MKPKIQIKTCGQVCRHAKVLLPLLLAASLASADSFTWSGTGTDANWTTAANWSGSAAPIVSTTNDLVFSGSVSLTNTNDFPAASNFHHITFDATSGAFTLSGNAITLNGNIISSAASSAVVIAHGLAIPGATIIALNGGASSANITLSGNITGSGTITQNAGGSGAKSLALSGDNSGFTGTFIQSNNSNNRTAFNAASAGSASATWEFNRNVAGGVAINGSAGNTLNFGALRGGAFIRSNSAGITTFRVGALNTSTTWSGQINDNGNNNIALIKVGTGTLTFSGANSYDGATSVNGGTLELSSTGSIPNSTVTINNSGILKVASGGVINALTINSGGTLDARGNMTVTNAVTAASANTTISLVNSSSFSSLSINGAAGLTLGGATASDTASLNLEVGADVSDLVNVSGALLVDAGGVSINITNLGLLANQSYTLATFSSASGAGFATGTGTTVGAIRLANPTLTFGVTGSLEVTANSIVLNTSGATPPAAAYWSGSKGSNWADNASGQGNFTTTATGSAFINTSPANSTQVYFSNSTPTNLTHTLGGNFDVLGLTYRGSSAAVTTTGSNQLTLESGGITIENGNAGATLGMSSLLIATDQIWTNNSSHPLTISAANVTGPYTMLTITGSGGVQFGGSSFSVGYLTLNSNLDLKGTSLATTFQDSTGNISNTGTANATLTVTGNSAASLSGVISDNGSGSLISLMKSGGESLSMSGLNTYAGGTTLAGGTLLAGSNQAFGSGLISITAGSAILDLNGHSLPNELANSGANGSIITNGSTSTATVSTGFNPAGATGFIVSDFTITGTGDIAWSGNMRRTTGIGVMTKSGTNKLSLVGPGVVSSISLILNEGSVFLGKTTTSLQDLVINDGTLVMDPSNQVSTASIWSGVIGNTVTMNGGTWDLNDTGTNGVSNRVKRISGTGGTITNHGTGASLLVLAARDQSSVPTVSWAGNIQDGTGSVAVTIQWGGSANQVMQFSGMHTYSGNTTISENVMQAGADNVFSSKSNFILTSTTSNAGKLDLNNHNNTIGSLAGTQTNSQVLLGSATLTTGVSNASTLFAGIITGSGGIVKKGSGTFTLSGSNTYTGDTVVNAGILAVGGNSLADSGKLVISSSAKVQSTGTEDVGSLYFDGAAQVNGTWGATGSGAVNIDDLHFTGTGVIRVGGAGGYSTWASANAGGQTAEQDYDGDGIPNGIEYFMNASAGFTVNPGIINGVIAWPNGGNIGSSAYGTQFSVQTSQDLINWTSVSASDPRLGNSTNSVSYSLPIGSDKLFVRLLVNPQ